MKIWNGFYVYLSNIEKISDNDLEYTGAGGRDEREQLNNRSRIDVVVSEEGKQD